ncbi:PRC-barrel domain containing protein [Streptomyces sp. NPDC057445]|uniref:PRC-barrel domain containing protein n=1 Tax=Streptomyces sp. NPDC057445 TaxID=3346136 RepID=UPI0036BA7EE5
MGAGVWGFPESAGYAPGAQLVGYKVEAADGTIGRIDKHSEEVGRSYIVVDTGPWIFGHRVLVPAGVVSRIDHENHTVHVAATKGEIKESPDFERGRDDKSMTEIHLIEQYYSKGHM